MSEKSLTDHRAVLMLENGEIFIGNHLGVTGTTCGEVVFNTSLSGYQEILTDPSYKTQLITLTTPEIGNYGIRAADSESQHIHAHGLIIKHYNPYRGRIHAAAEKNSDLQSFLAHHNTIAITDIDTRKLTRIIRQAGVCRGVITTEPHSYNELLDFVRKSPHYNNQDLASQVTTNTAYEYNAPPQNLAQPQTNSHHPINQISNPSSTKPTILVIDYGVKQNILRLLAGFNVRILVIPCTTTAAEIKKLNPAGILLSNGPGNPSHPSYQKYIDTIKTLINCYPMFGICLGHQLLALAYGENSYKLTFGHRGSNHPIQTDHSNKIEITSQNHGFAITPSTAPTSPSPQSAPKTTPSNHTQTVFSHINLNDQTIAGFDDPTKMCFSVQYHPEGAPGPHDSYNLFEKFIKRVAKFQKHNNIFTPNQASRS